MGLIEAIQVSSECLTSEQLVSAKYCADLLHEHLPEHFPEPFDLVIVGEHVLVDISLRMLKPKELFKAQSFPGTYIINEIPDPKHLFVDGKQVNGDPRLLPRIRLTAEAQVRMCGNSVAPAQAEAIARVTFAHELEMYGLMPA